MPRLSYDLLRATEECFMNGAMASQRLDALVARHRDLHEQVDELERHRYLTPSERQRVTRLKKMRLAAKDEIAALKRQT
jgi:uncharacterized protein YdcH (DUF465 family)